MKTMTSFDHYYDYAEMSEMLKNLSSDHVLFFTMHNM